MTTDHVHCNWTALAARMGYTTTRTQRAQVLAATRRVRWSGRPAGEYRCLIAGPALRAVAAAVLASAASERGDRRAADPLHNLIRIGIARLPDGHPLIGLDDGHFRQYVLDLGNEAISVLTEPSAEQASSHVA